MKKVMKIAVLALIAIAVVGTGAFAGAQKEENGLGAAPGEAVNLSWFMWTGSQAEADAWIDLASNVTRQYPNITISFETDSWPGYWAKLQILIASGTTQDILSLQSLRATGYGSGFRPLDEFIANDPEINIEDFDPAILPNLTYEGQQVALPYDFGPYLIYYNRELFDKHDVPYPEVGWTFEDFLQKVEALSGDGDYGFVTSSTIDHWLPWVLSNGGTYLDENNRFNITHPKTVEAIQMLSDLIQNGQAPQMVATTNTNWHQEQWMAGNIGMGVNGPWQIINFKRNAQFDFGIATNPVGPAGSETVSAGSGFGVSKTTQYPEEAYRAVSVLTSPQSLETLALAGRAFPARKSVQPAYFTAEGVEPTFEPILSFAVEHSVPYRITDTWQQANDLIFRSMIPILNGEIEVRQGLEALQQRLNALQ